MIDYKGVNCPVCGDPFIKDDDIVVCPQCGAPYHRDCYHKEGQCVFQDLHDEGKEWVPPAPPQAPEASTEIKDQECSACGCLNAHSALFCNRCGAPLMGQPHRHANADTGPRPSQAPAGPYVPPPYPGAVPFGMDPMGGVNPGEKLAEGVSFGDASKLVRQNTAYYMPVFRYIKNTGRNKFNFSAFLFSGAWMLYRKQYKHGAIVTGLMFVIYLMYLAASVFVATPTLLQLMEQAGMDLTRGFSPTSEQMIIITNLLTESPELYLRISLPMLCLLLILAVMIFVGVRGNKMYMNHCVRTVREVKRANVAENPNMTLNVKGGVNPSIAACMFVCYFILVNVVPLLL